MTIREFSDGFDTLLSSFRQRGAFGDQTGAQDIVLDEYEKSFFLTKAQEEVVISLYTGRNSAANSFEETEELRRYLADLVNQATLNPITTSTGLPLGAGSTHKFFTLPSDLWFITYESVKIGEEDACEELNALEVVPVTQDTYHKIKKNPFRGPNKRRALRLDLADGVVEIITIKDYNITSYYVRYLKKLDPIMLVDVDGTEREDDNAEPCKLHEALHQRILERAVQMALQSKGYYKENK
jgi:hypothetical protein